MTIVNYDTPPTMTVFFRRKERRMSIMENYEK